ncbi:MAG TPA: hypothetical protein VF069_00810 [Streptosporangiaceae bacterium]
MNPASAANNLSCKTGHDNGGPNAWATCTGSGNWRMDIYCDWPSPSPITNPWVYQTGGTQTSRGSCWFGRAVQSVTIEQSS